MLLNINYNIILNDQAYLFKHVFKFEIKKMIISLLIKRVEIKSFILMNIL